jgi:hypothetical protein
VPVPDDSRRKVHKSERLEMPVRQLLPLLAILTLALAGCSEAPVDIVGAVKAGTLPSNTATTIGKAFGAAFPNGIWTSWETGMGEMFAEFNAITTAENLEAGGVPDIGHGKCIDGVQRPCRLPVKFQFTLSSNNKTVGLVYVEAPERVVSDAKLKALLAFVCR